MIDVYKSEVFNKWLKKLRDRQAKNSIQARIDRLVLGHFGDVKSVGGGISEMRIHCGAGYRLYFVRRGQTVIVLLCGGDKKTQSKDILIAKEMAEEMEF